MARSVLHASRPLLAALAGLLAIACVPAGGPSGVGATPRKSSAPGPTASAPPSLAPGPAASAPAGASPLPAGGGPVGTPAGDGLADRAGSLIGRVMVPAGIVSNHGGGLIGNNGGGVLANNGGNVLANNGASWRLLAAPAEAPLAGALVRLVDAAGQPVTGADGQPLTATTDAQGGYGFTAALPARNLVIDVALPEAKGAVRAVVPREGAGRKVVDVDLVSTLTTGYILERFVATQADKLATLERLPAAVERETRALAASAVAAASLAPIALRPADVVEAVDMLRRQDKPFDQQMEVVKRLLVIAGASELGEGLPATEVTLKGADALAFAPDGTLHVLTTEDNRIWRRRADGTLEVAAGDRRAPDALDLAGKRPTEANLDHPVAFSFDRDGHMFLLDARGAYRVGSDGTLERVTTLKQAFALAPGRQGDAVVGVLEPVTQTPEQLAENGPLFGDPMAFAVYRCQPGRAPELLFRQPQDPEDEGVASVQLKGLAWDGGDAVFAHVVNGTSGRQELWRYDLASKALTVEAPSAGNGELYLDAAHVIYRDAAGAQHARALFTAAPDLPVPATPTWTNRIAIGPDGKTYYAKFGVVYRQEPTGPVRVVGTEGSAGGGNASVFTFEVLGESAVAPDGTVYALDTGKGAIYRVGADRQITRLADPGRGNVQLLRTDRAGTLYMSDGDGAKIGRFDAQGVWTPLFDVPPLLTGFEVAADGTAYALAMNFTDRKYHLYRCQGAERTELEVSAVGQAIGLDAAGRLHAMGGGMLRRWDGAAFQVLKADARFASPTNLFGGSALAFDAQGRFYVIDPARPVITRYDPATGTFTDVAGAGTPNFSGGGTDDGLKAPRCPGLDAAGNLYFSDTGNRQVKRIAAEALK